MFSLTSNPPSCLSLCQVLDPEKQADLLDSLRICLLQFSTLLVEHAPHHIHDNNKSRNSKLRRLMTFAWPCLLPKACVDPACKYSGHLLLAHIIAKFAIHKKIVLQVRRNAVENLFIWIPISWALRQRYSISWRIYMIYTIRIQVIMFFLR